MKYALVLSLWVWFSCTSCAQSTCPIPQSTLKGDDYCGWLEVPELSGDSEGAKIRLAYVVIKSTGDTPKQDPVVFLQGGPGGSVLPLYEAYRNINPDTDRDFILFDPRGTGYSGALCPDLSQQMMDLLAEDLDGNEEFEKVKVLIEACKSEVDGQGKNLTGYTTRQNVEDLEALRKHLGYEHWNIFGGSYGTRLGLTYQQLYPEAIRSAILVGLFPPEIRMYDGIISNMDRSLQWVFDQCEGDPRCAQRYPNLAATFKDVLRKLAQRPFEFSWRGRPFYLNDQDFLLFVHQSLYDRNGIGNLPRLINAVEEEDQDVWSQLADQIVVRFGIINLATYWSIMTCDEGSYDNQQLLNRDLKKHKLYDGGISLFSTDPQIYQIWSNFMNCPDKVPNGTSEIPTLLVSGSFDPVTPPHNAKPLKKRLKESQSVVIEGEGHAPFNRCFFQLLAKFLDDPNKSVPTTCAGQQPDLSWR